MHFKFCVVRSTRKVKIAMRTTFPLAILPDFICSYIMEKEAKQASLYVWFYIEKPESQVERWVMLCVGDYIPASTTQYSETGHRVCVYLLPGITHYMITHFGLAAKELESLRGFGAHTAIQFSKHHWAEQDSVRCILSVLWNTSLVIAMILLCSWL